jgi:hypothetical protein
LRIRAWLIGRRDALVATILPSHFVGVNNNGGRVHGYVKPVSKLRRMGEMNPKQVILSKLSSKDSCFLNDPRLFRHRWSVRGASAEKCC